MLMTVCVTVCVCVCVCVQVLSEQGSREVCLDSLLHRQISWEQPQRLFKSPLFVRVCRHELPQFSDSRVSAFLESYYCPCCPESCYCACNAHVFVLLTLTAHWTHAGNSIHSLHKGAVLKSGCSTCLITWTPSSWLFLITTPRVMLILKISWGSENIMRQCFWA